MSDLACARKLPSGPDQLTYGAVISACEERKSWLPPQQRERYADSRHECVRLVSACPESQDHWELALHLLNDMSASKLQLNEAPSLASP